jgi:hypothetical protein
MRTEIANLPGRAECGGYVYVIAFDGGLVKVGCTRHARSRLGDHEKDGRTFGRALTDLWVSSPHDGWQENEQSLIGLAQSLGGIPVSPEYFNGVDFAALVEEARELPFPAPDIAKARELEAAARQTPTWLDAELARNRAWIREDLISEDEAIAHLADRLLTSEREFAGVLIGRHLRRQLMDELARKAA